MAISDEEAEMIKEHLLKQLSNFPEDRRTQIEDQINGMTNDEIEEFVKKNQLTHLGNQCIFCSIISGKIESVKIDDDSDNIAVLDINPLSKGHALIIPREHAKEILQSSKNLAKRVETKLKNKFNPKEIKVKEAKIMGHQIIEVIPIYGDENESEKKSVSIDELKKLKDELIKEDTKKETEAVPILPPKKEPLFKMRPRIP